MEFRKNPKRGKKGQGTKSKKGEKGGKIFKRGNLPPMEVILGALCNY
jgi:hypothetical protein